MQHNGMPTMTDAEKMFAGERLYSALQIQTSEAIDLAVMRASDAIALMSTHEITGIIVHGLLEAAMRQIMTTKMPVTLAEFEGAARLVYASCHQHEEGHRVQ